MTMPRMTVISPTTELADQINHDVWVSIPKKALRDELFVLNGERIFSGKDVWMPARDLLNHAYIRLVPSCFANDKDLAFMVSLKFKTQQIISAGLQIYGSLSATDAKALNHLIDTLEQKIKNTQKILIDSKHDQLYDHVLPNQSTHGETK